ncbi:MAG: tripartite tricarboxylate transporter substrate binding protein [Pseudomonadota bacterium]
MLRLLLSLLLVSAVPCASAQDTGRPIRIVVPYAAGGTTDQVARLLQKPLSDILGQAVIVDNRPGAAGTIGTEYVARSPADGNTLVFGNPAPSAFLPALRKTGYDPIGDFRPISTVAIMPMLLVVPTASGIVSLRDFLQRAKDKPGSINYGSSGIGSLAHLTGAQFSQRSGLGMVHIPYAGGAPMMAALFQGDLQATFTTGLDGAAMVQSGRARYIAVASAQRDPRMPELPAITEELPGFQSVVWFALFAPKGTPDAVANRLRGAVLAVLGQHDFRHFLEERHAQAQGSTPEELQQRVRNDIRQWSEVVKAAQIPMD